MMCLNCGVLFNNEDNVDGHVCEITQLVPKGKMKKWDGQIVDKK